MLDAIADRLYALAPEEFTAARDAACKQHPALAKQVKALRKPTTSAWLVNALVRAAPQDLTELLELGPALAQAQRVGDGAALRSLGEQRRQRVAALAQRAAALSPEPVSAAVQGEVVTTLEAGLAEPASAAAVRSGRLVRGLSFAGFGGVDLDGAVAVPASRPGSKAAPAAKAASADRAQRVTQAEQVALAAAGALDDAVRGRQEALSSCEAAGAVVARTSEALDRLRAQVVEAERALAGAHRAQQAAQDRVEASTEALVQAQEAAEVARRDLDVLRREG